MIRLAALAALAAGSVLLAGCATREAPRAPEPKPPSARPQAPAAALPSAEYVALAGSTDLFEIRSSELALSRSADPRVRQFARMMIEAHTGTSAQLSFAGRRLNLLPSATLRQEHEAMLAELSASAHFDSTYIRQQIAVHEAALKVHSAYAARGSSPTLRPVAAAAVPIVCRHLDMLRAMR